MNWKKKIKGIPILVVIAVLAVSLVSAALIEYYGITIGSATVVQSLTIGGNLWNVPLVYTIGSSAVAGNTYINGPVSMANGADVPVVATFETEQEADYGSGYVDASDAVDTSYYGELELENKDTNWDIIVDGTSGSLKYYLDGNEFTYEFSATGLTPETEYSLIYYADEPDRFVNWGGNNPGALIATFTTDTNGDIASTPGSVDLGMDLPSSPDANIDEYSYCPDEFGKMYDLCHGAKIWLVLSSDYSEPKLTAWNPSEYLFETDLISYNDGDDGGAGFTAYQGTFGFYIENTFEPDAEPGEYRIRTEIQPA